MVQWADYELLMLVSINRSDGKGERGDVPTKRDAPL